MAESRGGGGDKLVDFMIGAGIGALITLLFARKAGSELRSEIADTTRKGFDYAHDSDREIGERVSDLTARGKEAAGDLTERGKEQINRQKAQRLHENDHRLLPQLSPAGLSQRDAVFTACRSSEVISQDRFEMVTV